jgi:serine/threonine-protein kinase
MTDLVGRVLSGRYRLTAPIGAGASAQVFLAEDARLRRRVAVKLLHAGLADDEGFLRRFRAEAQAAAALNHPHIVAVYDWGDDEGTPYLVTELLSGGSLRGMLDAGHRLSPSQALLIGLEATRALDHAHRRGFVHRDIKPANLLFGEEGRLRIADFGLARALAEAAWTEPAGSVVGTARYASPEQARGESVDGRGDVYALGLTLIEAVTGRVPFASDTTIGMLMARIDTPVEVPAALGPLRRALTRAGLPDADERPDAGDFGVALMAAAEELPRPAPLPLVGATPMLAGTGVSADLTMLPGANPVAAVGADPTTVTQAADPAPTGGAVYDLAEEDELALDGDAPPRRKRIWLRVLLSILLLAALAGGGYVAAQTLLVPSHEVPTFEGMDQAAAEALAEENGWDVVTREDREDGSTPGEVLGQDPQPGESLKEGEDVTLTISLGQALKAVPTDLAGLAVADAEARLVEAGLTVGEAQHTFDETVPAGVVLGLAEGTPPELETGTAVSLRVSDGPAPRVVPSLPAGVAPADGCVAIQAVQLACSTQDVFSDTVPAGQVVGTEPAAGTEVPRDSAVAVQVSKGPEFIPVPNVSGMSVADATATLQQAGLVVEVLPAGATGQVIVTDPLPGEQVRRGTAVSMFARRN